MKAVSWTRLALTALIAACGTAAACSSSNSPPATTNSTSTGGSTGGGSTNTTSTGSGTSTASTSTGGGPGSSSSTGASSSSSTSTSSSTASSQGGSDGGPGEGDAGIDSGDSGAGGNEAGSVAACGNVTANVTQCAFGSTPQCDKGCGPDLPPDSGQPQLGTKTCTCEASDAGDAGGVYACGQCLYLSPEPACYEYADGAPPACLLDAGAVGDKLACSAPCVGGTTSGVCMIVTDAGTTQGCVCIPHASGGSVWTCQTLWPSQ